MGLAYSQIDDAVLATQNLLVKRGAFVNMQTDLQDHIAVREMWKTRRKVFAGGQNWELEYQMDHNHSAKPVGLYQQDSSSMVDTLAKGEVPVRHVNAHYEYDQRLKAFQQGGTEIVNLITAKYSEMMVSLYEMLEEQLWGKPTDSSDLITPWGIAYWITRNATEGFTGGNPAGFTDGRAGINTTTYPRYANYSGAYTAITVTDLLRKMRNAHRRTMFRSPLSHSEPMVGKMGNGIYTNDAVVGILEELLETRNMNLGTDLAKYEGSAVFKSTPIQWAPYLDDDSTNPVYMLDWKTLAIGVMAGWEGNLGQPYMVPGKHLVRRVDFDASLNMICTDPRKQAVFYVA